jgi:predicted ATPase/DNA-binding SARP family transcriptional activator
MVAEPVLEICLLGGFATRVGAQLVPAKVWRQRRAAAIVKLLALEPGHRLHREHLLETLWPDFDPDSAANNLRGALHHARLGLERAGAPSGVFLAREGESLVLGPRESLVVDVEVFTEAASLAWHSGDPATAERAVELYTGDLLPDDPYEEWAAARREGLRASYLTVLTRLAGLHEERGELPQAIAVHDRILRTEPLDEAAHAGIIRLYAQTGNPQRALAHYARMQTLLDRELGTAPEPTTQALAAAIRAGHVAPAPADVTPLSATRPPVRATIAPGARLPVPVDALVGREREVAELDRLLATARLVTLTGPGGIGKTRLAQETARAVSARFPDGVAFVDLAPLRDPSFVLPTIARALGVDETGARPITELVTAAVGERRLLLVLDNFEQLAAAAADLAGILDACTGMTVLTTSRVRLRLRREQEYPVLPLALPERVAHRDAASLADLSQVAAIALFARRARAARPGFTVTEQNIDAVVAICRRLDGLPLAIELAAAQVRVLAPAQLLQRLDRPLDVLGTTTQDVPARQQTLRNAIAWSYDLLTTAEQSLFRRLSVFVGGWSLDGAAAIATVTDDPHPIDVVETLGGLIDQSLVETRPGADDAELRYAMLGTIRQFAAEQLQVAGELLATEYALESFLLDLGERAELGLHGPEQSKWLDRLDIEHDNIRAVLGWDLQRESSELALRLTVCLWRFWLMRGYPGEGRMWLERAIAGGTNASAALRAGAQHGLGHLAIDLGNYIGAEAHFKASLELCPEIEDRRCRADALSGLGVVALNRQKYSEAQALLDEAHAIRRELDDKNGIAWSLYYLGIVAREWGNYGQAENLFAEALAMWRELGNPERIGHVLVGLAVVSRFEGNLKTARPLIEEGLSVLEGIGHRYGVAVAHMQFGHVARLEGDTLQALHHYVDSLVLAKDLGANEVAVEDIEFVACVATTLGQAVRAGRLFGAAAAFRSAFELPPHMDSEVVALEQHMVAAQRAAMNDWSGAWSEGQVMSFEQAIAEARALLSTQSEVAASTSGAEPASADRQ